jgi:hypothetical protein
MVPVEEGDSAVQMAVGLVILLLPSKSKRKLQGCSALELMMRLFQQTTRVLSTSLIVWEKQGWVLDGTACNC